MHSHAELPAQAERIVADAGIPPCPAVLAKLVREARSDEPDLERIAGLVSSDPALAASILKTANSALYTGGSPLSSVRQALMRVGMRNAAEVITGLLLRQAFPVGGAQMERFWESSSRIAALSAHIAGALGTVERETAFTFGLFRDCGTAVLLQRFADYPRLVAAAPKIGRRVTDVEAARYGATHPQVGFAMARGWLLHDHLCTAVLLHHSPDAQCGRRSDLDPTSMRLIAVAALAEHAHMRESDEAPTEEVSTALAFSLSQLGISESALDEIVAEAETAA
jgi:HD-like signal output (HDOD) protein